MKSNCLFFSLVMAVMMAFTVVLFSTYYSFKSSNAMVVMADDTEDHDEYEYPEDCYWGMLQCDDFGPDLACRIGTNGDACKVHKCKRCDD